MEPTTAAIVGTLGGAIVATTGTLIAQRLSGRDAERRAAADRRDDRLEVRRVEVKKAIEAFFFAAERAQSACDSDVTDGEKRSASDQLWAAFKTLSLVGSDLLRDTAAAYAEKLHQSLWNPDGEPAWQRAFAENRAFTAQARTEIETFGR